MTWAVYHLVRARELLREESRWGVRIPWTGKAAELRDYVAWLLTRPRSRWPVDPSPIGCTAACVALAARRLWGGATGLKPEQAARLVLDVATTPPRPPANEAA